MFKDTGNIADTLAWYSLDISDYQAFLSLYVYIKTTKTKVFVGSIPNSTMYWWKFNLNHTPTQTFKFISNIGFKSEAAALAFILACPDPRINFSPIRNR